MIKYKTTKSSRKIKEWKGLVIAHRLHFQWGSSGIKVACAIPGYPVYSMAMAFDGETPIGVAIITESHVWDCNLMVYVKSKYRRRGIGTSLIHKAKARCKKEKEFNVYSENYRRSFYKKAGVIK